MIEKGVDEQIESGRGWLLGPQPTSQNTEKVKLLLASLDTGIELANSVA